MNNTTYTGYISLLLKGTLAVFPITSADGVLLEPTGDTTKLSEKLVEIDKGIEQITKVTNTILKNGDGSIEYTEDGLAHTNTTNIPEGLLPTVNEAVYKFKIDNNGHITEINKAGLEDFGIGMPIKYCGEYPTNNSSFTPSVGEMYLVNTVFISKYGKGDVNDFAIYDGVKFNIILSDITPNIQLNNSDSRIYGIGDITNIYAPTELGEAGYVLATNTNKDGLEWKNIPTYSGDEQYIHVDNNNKISLNTNAIKNLNTNINISGENGITVSSSTLNNELLYTIGMKDITVKLGDNDNSAKIGIADVDTEVILKGSEYISIIPNSNDKKVTFELSSNIINTIKATTELGTRVGTLEESISEMNNEITGDNTHVKVKVTQKDGKITGVAVTEDDIASDADLTTEIKARKAVDGQNGDKYSANTTVSYISNATSLNDADIKLSNAITTLNTKFQNEIWGSNVDSTGKSRIDTLETSVDSMNRAYPHIINEIYGDGTTNDWDLDKDSRIDILTNNTLAVLKEIWGENHNYDWSKSSRIDNLESTIKLSFEDEINYGNNIFNFGLIFENISLATHNNAIVAGTNLGKIHLPTTGKCKICFKVLGAENTQILIGNHIKDVLLGSNDTVVKYTEYIIYDNLSKPYLNIKSTNGKIFIKDLSIQFENYNNITQQKIIKTVDTYTNTRTINELGSGFMPELGYNTYTDLHTVNVTEPGFYKLTYEILASRDSCIAALMYYTPDLEDTPFKVDDYSWVTKPDYGLDSSGTINWYVNMDWYKADCMKAYPFKSNTNKTCLILYYVPYIHSYGCILYLRVYGDQNYLNTTFKINDFHLDKVVLNTETINNGTINTSTINNSVINNPNLILSSGTSKLFSGTNDAGYVCLKYTLDGILKWTLDENGIQMNTDSNLPVEPIEGTMFYYSLNRPTINTQLSRLEKRILNVFAININTTNGYYINPINMQLGLDYEVHDCYVIDNGSLSTINIYVQNDRIIQNPNLVV